jgi:hypothetical protein
MRPSGTLYNYEPKFLIVTAGGCGKSATLLHRVIKSSVPRAIDQLPVENLPIR